MSSDDPFARLEARRRDRDAERMQMNKRLAEMNREAEEDAVAEKVLRKLYPETSEDSSAEHVARVRLLTPAGEASVVARQQAAAKAMQVKDLLLLIAKEAHPNGLSAAQIRGKAQLKYGIEINPNTLTVSMVRHAKKGRVRSAHKMWFYVPDTAMAPLLNGNRGAVAAHKEAAE